MRAIHARFATVVLTLLGGLHAADAASVKRSYSYFPVSGSTLEEIRADLERRGPKLGLSRERHAAATHMAFRDRVTYDKSGGQCRIATARVTVDAQVQLPRWSHNGRVSDQTKIVWGALAADIRRHEEMHITIARKYAGKMELALLALPPQSNCDRAAQLGRKTVASLLNEQDREQAQFDRQEGRTFIRRIDKMLRGVGRSGK